MHDKPTHYGDVPADLPPIVSSLAVVSVVFALLSPALLCLCGVSLLTSLAAVITGHLALKRIREADGQLSGRGAAIVGLSIGYLMIVVTIVFLAALLPKLQTAYFNQRRDRVEARQADPRQPPRYRPSESPATIQATVLADVPVTRELVCEIPELGWTVHSLAFAPDGNLLAVGKLDRSLLIVDVHTAETRCKLEDLNQLSAVEKLAFSADGTTLYAAGSSGPVMHWSIDAEGQLSEPRQLFKHEQKVTCLVAGSPGAPVLSGSADGRLMWRMPGEEHVERLNGLPKKALAAFLPADSGPALATDGSTLLHFDLGTSRITATRQFPPGAHQAAAFSRDGSKLAVTAGYEVRVYDVNSGASLAAFKAGNEMQWTVAFHPDGRRLITGGRGFATLWDVESESAEWRFDLGGILYVQTLAISPDGTRLAAVPAAAGQTLSVLQIPAQP